MSKIKLLKRWKEMVTGKSSFNVEQGVGKIYSTIEIKGYYNDLTNKVSNNTKLDNHNIPINITISRCESIFSYFDISIWIRTL